LGNDIGTPGLSSSGGEKGELLDTALGCLERSSALASTFSKRACLTGKERRRDSFPLRPCFDEFNKLLQEKKNLQGSFKTRMRRSLPELYLTGERRGRSITVRLLNALKTAYVKKTHYGSEAGPTRIEE